MLATATDYRLAWILREGDTIQTAEATYTITGEPIGLGGSSVLYPASKSGSYLEYAIKECFPTKPAVYQRINGIIQTANPDDELNQAQIENYREMLFNERKLGQEIRNTTTRAVSVWDELIPISITTSGEIFQEVSGGIFSVLERMDKKGRFFNELLADIRNACPPEDRRTTFGLPSIQVTVQIMEQALLALKQVHDAGYYFGDLSGSNLLLTECEPEKNHIGIGHLIDFGSTRKLESDGFTAPIVDEPVFSTDGFRPFEIRDHKDGTLRLGKQADIYSAGCLFLRCVLSPAKIRTLGDSPSVGNNALNEVNGKAIGCTGRTLQLVNEILDKATKYAPKDRYADASEMLGVIQKLKKYTEPPKYLLPSNLSSPDYWVPHSRDSELSAILKSVNEGETVFLYGVGGIGKTECAIQAANRLSPPRGAYLVHFQNSMKETILRMNFSGYKFEPKQKGLSPEDFEEAEYQDRITILREHYRDTVLIVDNFDVTNKTLDDLRREPAFKDFLGLDLRRIFTTRYPVGRKDWEICELSETDLLKLMRYYCTDSSITDEQYLTILKEIQNHTLTATLIAKTLEESWGDITPEVILKALRSSSLAQEDYPEVISDQNRSYQQKRIYEHLKVLFDLSGMNNYDRIVLCCASLLPDDGLDALLFKRCLQKDETKSLTRLVKCGWLNRCANNQLAMHPVIREVCCEELQPTLVVCQSFLDNLWETFDYNNPFQISAYQKLASVFLNASVLYDEEAPVYLYHVTLLFNKMHYVKRTLESCNECLSAFKKLSAKYELSTQTAEIHRILGDNLCRMGYYDDALSQLQKSKEILDTHCLSNSDLKAWLSLSFGSLASSHKQWDKAIMHYSTALELFRLSDGVQSPNVGTTHLRLADILDFMGETNSANEHRRHATSILLKYSDASALIRVELIKDEANNYSKNGQYAEALRKFEELLNIYLSLYPNSHEQIAWVHYDCGVCYVGLGQGELAIRELTLAKKPVEETFGEKSRPFAAVLHFTAKAYSILNNFSAAIGLLTQAISIYESLQFDQEQLGVFCLELARYYDKYSYSEPNSKSPISSESDAVKWYKKSADLGNAEALNGLGYAYLTGRGVPKNLEYSFSLFLESAQKGCPAGMNNVAIAYSDGEGVAVDKDMAYYWYKKAALGGNVSAMVGLGNAYEYGKGTEANAEQAFLWYHQAAQNGSAYGANYLGLAYKNGLGCNADYHQAFHWFQVAANKGDSAGMFNLGCAYSYGRGTSEDIVKAEYWLTLASSAGSPSAPTELGELNEKQKKYANALYWYELGKKRGSRKAILGLGYLYWTGNGTSQDYSIALSYFEQAANMGSPVAMYNLGFAYQKGLGVQTNLQKSVMWYTRSSNSGHSSAKIQLASIYISQARSSNLSDNYSAQIELFDRAYQLLSSTLPPDDRKIQNLYIDIGRAYERKGDYANAFCYYTKLARLGDTFYMIKTARWMIDEVGCKRNFIEAHKLLSNAYALGHELAALDLGYLYLWGHGCNRDIEKAKSMFEKLANASRPHKGACEYLGDLYIEEDEQIRRIIPYSPKRALEYYTMAISPRNSIIQDKIRKVKELIAE